MERTIIEWRSGHPPHVGWWESSFYMSPGFWRWWDGRRWSEVVCDDASPDQAGRLANLPSINQIGLFWTRYWPEDARVPRRNPNHFL